MISIFSNSRKNLYSDIDTYVVKWTTYKKKFDNASYPYVEECFKAFTDKNKANGLAKALNDSMKLLGITSLPKATVYKQKANSV